MNLYLDASALVKRYIREAGSLDVIDWIERSQFVVTSIITRAEVAAAINRSERMGLITTNEYEQALTLFRNEWTSIGRLSITEATVQRADELACIHGLRGYDAVHLASALIYQDGLDLPVSIATFDRLLWDAGKGEGLITLPDKI